MKHTTLIFILIFTLVSTLAFAQEFKIDGNIGDAGFQNSTTIIDGIGGGERVGFAVYVRGIDSFNAYTLNFSWDSSKATFLKINSGTSIGETTMTINGRDVSTTAEANALGSVNEIVGTDEAGIFSADYALLGDTGSASDWSLLYFAVFETDSSFETEDSLEIEAAVTVVDPDAGATDLGSWNLYVNSSTGVESKSWGEIKTEFDF